MQDVGRLQRQLLTRLIVAVLYAVCLLAPHAAQAASKAAGHCLTEVTAAHVHPDHDAATGHAHADGADPHHADAATSTATPDGDNHAGMCCGVFCLTGLMAEPVSNPSVPTHASRIAADLGHAMDGRVPDRIIRPPKA
jgi:hypothetical protein